MFHRLETEDLICLLRKTRPSEIGSVFLQIPIDEMRERACKLLISRIVACFTALASEDSQRLTS